MQRVAEMADWDRKRDNTPLGCAFVVYRRDLQQLQPELQGIEAPLVRHLVEKYLRHKLVRDVARSGAVRTPVSCGI